MSIATCQKRIIEIAAKRGLSHLGSCFSCLPILVEIYKNHPDDVVILSSGHAGLALYCVLEDVFGYDADALFAKHGVHPGMDPEHRIYCSTGSLGCGLAVAIGYALAGSRTHCVISDGECFEGIVWESLAFLSQHALPIHVYVNSNGFGAIGPIDRVRLRRRLLGFYPNIRFCFTSNAPLPDDLDAHYMLLTPEEADRHAKTIR